MTCLPPFLMVSEPGSFARETIEVRKAKIIAGVLADHDYPEAVRRSLADFAAEIIDGRPVAPVPAAILLREEWVAALAPWQGRTWLQQPWYLAEAYFYVRLLAIVGYFEGRSPDPFARRKRALLQHAAAILPSLAAAETLAARLPRSEAFALLVRRSLWGNRLDLSNEAILERHRDDASHLEDAGLLVDDIGRALAAIDAGGGRPACFICDNSGPEIVSDLHLVDWLLRHTAGAVVLALKAQPFFVSDAMVADAQAAIAFLAAGADGAVAGVGRRLGDAVSAGRLALRDHPFWSGPGFYSGLPADLSAELAGAALVVAKGDVNYRRFIEDRHWPFHTPIERAARGFPAPALLLRTLKGELAAGLPQAAIVAAAAEGSDWLVSGRYGVAQFVPLAARAG